MSWSPKRDLIALANRAGEVSAGAGEGAREGRALPLPAGRHAFAVTWGMFLVRLAKHLGVAIFF